MKNLNIDELKYSWTAEVELKNGQVITIWYTCWPSIKNLINKVISISSDLPKCLLTN